MSHDMQAIKEEYGRLDSNKAIINLLSPLLRSRATMSDDDIGWAFWTVCDRYAMLRRAREQYGYQSEFHEWSKADHLLLKCH